jgi:hypothetical protein
VTGQLIVQLPLLAVLIICIVLVSGRRPATPAGTGPPG